MAENKGIIKIKGKLGPLSFYNSKRKKNLVKWSSGHSGDTIKNDPAFANVRKNNNEFGGGSVISKALRQSWGPMGRQFQDSYMAGRLTSACRKLIIQSSGDWGIREGNLRTHGNQLIGFAFDKEQPFSYGFSGAFQADFKADRSQCILTCNPLYPEDFANKPAQATHVQFTAAISLVSNHYWNKAAEKYLPKVPKQNALGNIQTTGFLPIHELPIAMEWVLNTPNDAIPQANVACVVTLGISYGVLHHRIERLRSGQTMHILSVV
ncbi:MAG: hypothetical protein K8F54_01785 [Altibacter sp.]|uniref:hypothetical protein n=1 Tax=Altibacter sp. TaxID=2024823 RepID=UPI001D439D81|nr:hypothetical protein [Altibacter sp.]MBZ0326311.1 hypothetical protein [Altibacter sp.]